MAAADIGCIAVSVIEFIGKTHFTVMMSLLLGGGGVLILANFS